MSQEVNFPDHIAHKPVFVVPYFDLDTWWAGDTDAQFITLGWSQWDHRELSAKVVRRSEKRWSRQSEELPLPRVIDLAILSALAYAEGDNLVQIPAGTFENQSTAISVAYSSKRDRSVAAAELRADEKLRSRLSTLYDILTSLKERQLI